MNRISITNESIAGRDVFIHVVRTDAPANEAQEPITIIHLPNGATQSVAVGDRIGVAVYQGGITEAEAQADRDDVARVLTELAATGFACLGTVAPGFTLTASIEALAKKWLAMGDTFGPTFGPAARHVCAQELLDLIGHPPIPAYEGDPADAAFGHVTERQQQASRSEAVSLALGTLGPDGGEIKGVLKRADAIAAYIKGGDNVVGVPATASALGNAIEVTVRLDALSNVSLDYEHVQRGENGQRTVLASFGGPRGMQSGDKLTIALDGGFRA